MSWVRYDFQNVRIKKSELPALLPRLIDAEEHPYEVPASERDGDGTPIPSRFQDAGFNVRVHADGVEITGFADSPEVSLEDWYALRHLAGFVAEEEGRAATIIRLNFTETVYRQVRFEKGKAIEETGWIDLQLIPTHEEDLAQIAEPEAG